MKAERKGRVESGLPFVFSKGIYCVTKSIDSTKLSLKINDYFIHEKGIKTIDEFYDDYLPFVTSCRKVTRNILKAPKVRLSWNNNLMINDTETYQNFINYLKEKADNDAVKRIDRVLRKYW